VELSTIKEDAVVAAWGDDTDTKRLLSKAGDS